MNGREDGGRSTRAVLRLSRKKKNNAFPGLAVLCAAAAALSLLGPFAVLRAARAREENAEKLGLYASELESALLFREAAEVYERAYRTGGESNPELLYRSAFCLWRLSDRRGAVDTLRRLLSDHGDYAPAYGELARVYASGGEYADAADIILEADALGLSGAIDAAVRVQVDYTTVRKYLPADSAGDWHTYAPGKACAEYFESGKAGIILSDGSRPIPAAFDSAGVYDPSTGLCPVTIGGEAFFVNEKGERALVLPDGTIDAGPFSEGLAYISDGEKYGYVNTKGEPAGSVEYDFAGSFSHGVAAVRAGEKWGLIDTKMRSVTPLKYDFILTDGNGFCSEYGLIAAKLGGEWLLLDASGKEIARGFEEAALPASADGLIAVKSCGLWGFCGREGKIIIEPQYEAAGSFSCGLAPVKTAEGWGYVDESGTPRTGFVYDEAGVFSSGGSSVVRDGSFVFLLVIAKHEKN